MFDSIYSANFDSSQTTKAICDGADVRYSMMFVAADDGSACAFICTVNHPGASEAIAHSGFAFGGNITSF